MRLHRHATILLLACAPSLLASCDGGEARTPVQSRLTRTDSAGIPILVPHAPAWDSTGGWRVDHDPLLTIGVADGDPMHELYNVWSAYRRDDGSIVVGNAGTASVRIFDDRGRLVRELGRHGNGPGEYLDMNEVFAYRGDSIGVFDSDARRVTLYDRSGELGWVASMPGTGPGTDIIEALGDGRLLTLLYELEGYTSAGPFPMEQFGRLAVVQPGARPDTVARLYLQMIGVPEKGRNYFPLYGYAAACGDGYLTFRTDMYELRFHDLDGRLRRILRPAINSEPFSDELFEEWKRDYMRQATGSSEGGGRMPPALVEKNQKMLASASQPAVIPPIGWVICDSGGNAWVREYPPGNMHTADVRHSVFSSDGEWLGRVYMPRATRIMQVGDDFVLTLVRDADEVEQVRLYALKK